MLISHVAYKMHESKLFSDSDVAKIWWNSMSAGYGADATYVDCRRSLINSAQSLGYSRECMDFIAYQFDLEEIFDDEYEIETEEYKTEQAGEDSASESTEGNSIDGDILFDDNEARRFILAYSPLGDFFDDVPIYIYEEKTGTSKKEIAAAEERLNTLFKTSMDNLGYDALAGSRIVYKQVPKWGMDLFGRFLSKSESSLHSMAYNSIGAQEGDEGTDIIEKIMKLALWWQEVEMTPYEFYESLGIIE